MQCAWLYACLVKSCFEWSHCAHRHSYNAKALPSGYEFVGLTEILGHLNAEVCYVCKEGERVIVKYEGKKVRVIRRKKISCRIFCCLYF